MLTWRIRSPQPRATRWSGHSFSALRGMAVAISTCGRLTTLGGEFSARRSSTLAISFCTSSFGIRTRGIACTHSDLNGGGDIDMWATDNPWWGILGTPVIDLGNKLLYVVVWNQDQRHRLYALDLQSGLPKKGPVVIQHTIVNGFPFFPSGNNNTQVHKQRSGLLLDHGSLYVAFGGDNGGQAGWLFVYDAGTLALKTVWSPIPKGPNGGIWMSGSGPLADINGSIYLQTANGDFNNQNNHWGDSLLKLSLTGTQIQVKDFFAPCDAPFLNAGGNDLDLGSAAPVFLPNNLILGGGKSGTVYLMDRDKLANFQSGTPPNQRKCKENSPLVLQQIDATPGHIHGAPVFFQGSAGDWVYVMGEGDNLKAFPFQSGRLKAGAADKFANIEHEYRFREGGLGRRARQAR